MYLDPPYVPVSLTSFVKYNSKSFSKEHHTKLFELLKKTKASFVMSNSDTCIVKEFFQGYSIKTISVKRRINSKNPQAIANEVIIKK
jgi:site-specific DNA-adenine methylase